MVCRFSGTPVLLQYDEDIDIGFRMSTDTGYRTEDTCPKHILAVIFILPDGAIRSRIWSKVGTDIEEVGYIVLCSQTL